MASCHQNADACYCEKEHATITEDIINHAIPVEAFMRQCCWQKICSVRNSSGACISPDVWEKVVSKRNQLYFNLNPFGQ